MNLFLALFWFLFGAAVLAWEWTTGDHRVRIRGTDLSIGWLLLALALYNLWRWWSLHTLREEQRARKIAEAQLQRYRDRHEREPQREPDPNFNFTDQPPPPANTHITDQPPADSHVTDQPAPNSLPPGGVE